MVTGTKEIEVGKNLDVEIVSLFARLSCLKPPDFSFANPMSLIGTFLNGEPIICGFHGQESFCHGLDFKNQVWKVYNYSLLEQRSQAASVALENGSWVIFGGQKYSEQIPVLLNTSEILIGSKFHFGPQLPLPMSGHCIVKFDKEQIFIAGGYGQPFSKQAHTLQINYNLSNIWHSIKPMNEGRYGHVCGRILTLFNDVQIVAAGGLRVDKVEIYLFRKKSWINGPDMLQNNVFKAASVQGSTSFLMIGGLELEPCQTLNCQIKDIFIFDRNNAWRRSQKELHTGRGNHIGIALPPDIECTSKINFIIQLE